MKSYNNYFILVLILFVSLAQAQDDFNRYGIKGGINFSTIASGQFNQEGVPRVGFAVGLVSEFPISPQVAFAPELVYSQQGNLTRFNENGIVATNGTHLNYINIPLQFKYYINPKFYIDLGPYIGAKITANSVLKSGGQRFSNKISEGVNFFDAGLGGSVGYIIDNTYFVTGRYSRGLSSVFNNTADVLGRRSRNSVFNISIGLYL